MATNSFRGEEGLKRRETTGGELCLQWYGAGALSNDDHGGRETSRKGGQDRVGPLGGRLNNVNRAAASTPLQKGGGASSQQRRSCVWTKEERGSKINAHGKKIDARLRRDLWEDTGGGWGGSAAIHKEKPSKCSVGGGGK